MSSNRRPSEGFLVVCSVDLREVGWAGAAGFLDLMRCISMVRWDTVPISLFGLKHARRGEIRPFVTSETQLTCAQYRQAALDAALDIPNTVNSMPFEPSSRFRCEKRPRL
jgi:hypothetical protein